MKEDSRIRFPMNQSIEKEISLCFFAILIAMMIREKRKIIDSSVDGGSIREWERGKS
jgi:hypothetical protein